MHPMSASLFLYKGCGHTHLEVLAFLYRRKLTSSKVLAYFKKSYTKES